MGFGEQSYILLRKSERAMPGQKPNYVAEQPHADGEPTVPIVEGGWIWCPLKSEWRVVTPEERVRQGYVLTLGERYGYQFDQMDQERRTKHGRKSPKADIVVWGSVEDRNEGKAPVIVVECKSEHVTIIEDDYEQGDSYARAIGDPCEFLVMHNSKETRVFRIVRGLPGSREEIEQIPTVEDLENPKRLKEIKKATKTFTREEFRRILKECHDILRDNHKLDPGAAFDEISKILFIKMWVERVGRHERFTEEYLKGYKKYRGARNEEIIDLLFEDTKKYYKADELFQENERLKVSFESFLRIVQKLERFNLSATSDDVKGIAFESFLGQTFRGELGQFFTPRPIVNFMVQMLDPEEGEIICDPAAGSGGFLIKCFEYVRAKVEKDIQAIKRNRRQEIEAEFSDDNEEAEEERANRIDEMYAELTRELEVQEAGTRLFRVAHECIFGTDAEARAARTSKMNMIMHGDGHGGIHHHDGLVDVNGVFEGRFDVVLTNPPFGATVRSDQKVGSTEETRVTDDLEVVRRYEQKFGDKYTASHARVEKAAKNSEPILGLYDIGRDPIGSSGGSVRNSRPTEMLFLERCIDLLKPGGRLGIVLPDGILNNPTNQWLRDYCEGRARLLAVISIPQDVFAGSDATVKPSLVFMQRFTERDEKAWAEAFEQAEAELTADQKSRRDEIERELEAAVESATNKAEKKAAKKHKNERLQALTQEERDEISRRAKEIFDYPIFMAKVEAAGITSSGDTGEHVPNELPEVLAAYQRFARDPDGYAKNLKEDGQQALRENAE